MMMDRRLIRIVSESKKYVAASVLFQWLALGSSIVIIGTICRLLGRLYGGSAGSGDLVLTACVILGAAALRFGCNLAAARMGCLSSRAVKQTLRPLIYKKLLRLGVSYQEQVQTSEAIQLAVEGVEQLETYFAQYLPQFFYAMLAPLTLFAVLAPVSLLSAVVLLLCVPLIPVAIATVQTWAKKLLGQYWEQYTALGDTFLENLQGLTTLKIYQADGFKNDEMNQQAEKFRKITMKVLTMQLNSITIMDLIAYGGAAAGMILAVSRLQAGAVNLSGCLLIILLSADFFIPMRLLGSFFHVAMNGMAASDKIFRLLDAKEPERGVQPVPAEGDIVLRDVNFTYEQERPILKDVSLELPRGSFTALVGESGCGKSTVASILMGRRRSYTGSVTVGGVPLADLSENSLMAHITYVSHNSYLFKGTVRDNLLLGCPDAGEADMWRALEQVRLDGFVQSEGGLDTPIAEKGSNLSGGQCQRLALARALLHNSPVYLFDEATSNIDVESENDIMALVRELAKTKTVLLISHRLANVAPADRLYVMDRGRVVEKGNHQELLAAGGHYARLWHAQRALETYGREDAS